jgi:hypothetical protein
MDNHIKITRNELDTLSRVMVKRIAKGYSAEELSFLIGFMPEYVPNVEMLREPVYDPEVLDRIMEALEERNFQTFFSASHNDEEVLVQVLKWPLIEKQLIQCRIINDKGYGVMHLSMEEELNTCHKGHPLYEINFKLALDALKLLIESGYFLKERTNLEIYQRINAFFPAGTIRPFYVKDALDEVSLNTEHAELVEVELNERYGYYVAC